MYEEQFGLRPRPFGDPASPGDLVPLPSRDAPRLRLRYGLEHGQGPALLSGRLTARCLLGPLAAPESASYVAGRLANAGASAPLFDPPALAELHRQADGLPRRLNRLADLALLIAYAEGSDRPDARTVL